MRNWKLNTFSGFFIFKPKTCKKSVSIPVISNLTSSQVYTSPSINLVYSQIQSSDWSLKIWRGEGSSHLWRTAFCRQSLVTDSLRQLHIVLCSSYSGGFITSPHCPASNFVYRFTKSPQIQVEMLMVRGTTESPPLAPSQRGNTTNRQAFCLVQHWVCAWPQGSLIQRVSGLRWQNMTDTHSFANSVAPLVKEDEWRDKCWIEQRTGSSWWGG